MYLIVGESGVGKNAITDVLCNHYGYKQVCSYTTRERRENEGDTHIFLTDDEFYMLRDIVAYTEFDGVKYAATLNQLEQADLYIVDVDGIKTLKKNKLFNRPIKTIYLTAPPEELLARMIKRGDSEEVAERRIEHDKIAFVEAMGLCDKVVYNIDFNNAINQVFEYIKESEANPVVYVSHPFQNKIENFQAISEIMTDLIKKYGDKYTFFSPIHNFSYFYEEEDYQKGLQICMDFLPYCSECWVFGDYENSRGCVGEIECCKKLRIPVKYEWEVDV